MKTIIAIATLFMITTKCYSQNDFKPGWYIVEKGATYAVYAQGFLDYTNKGKAYDRNELTINPGEVVFLWEQSNGLYIANEWFGRISIFKTLENLTRVPDDGKIAYLLADIDDLNGKVMTSGSAVWVTAFNTANKTITVIASGGKKYEIPAKDVTMLANYITGEAENTVIYRKVK